MQTWGDITLLGIWIKLGNIEPPKSNEGTATLPSPIGEDFRSTAFRSSFPFELIRFAVETVTHSGGEFLGIVRFLKIVQAVL